MYNQPTTRPAVRSRAPLHWLLAAQLVAGFALGATTAYLGSLIGGLIVPTDTGGFRDVVAMISGVLIGYPLGVSCGVWLVGRWLGSRGRLWATGLGAYLGVGVVLLVARLLLAGDFSVGWLLMIALSLAGACAGYHLSVRGSAPERTGA